MYRESAVDTLHGHLDALMRPDRNSRCIGQASSVWGNLPDETNRHVCTQYCTRVQYNSKGRNYSTCRQFFIKTHQTPPKPIQIHQNSSKPIKLHPNSSEPHQIPSKSIKTPSKPIKTNQDSSKSIVEQRTKFRHGCSIQEYHFKIVILDLVDAVFSCGCT